MSHKPARRQPHLHSAGEIGKRQGKGVFLLGIDVELAWGLVHKKSINFSEVKRASLRVRDIVDDLFAFLEEYEIPVSWAILGHLLLDRCSRSGMNGLPHPEMPRPSYSWLSEDWYRYDPCTDVERDPAWYGSDVVKRIVEYVEESKLPHEVGCHSFSHQQFGDPGCGEELARAEIKRCVELMETRFNIVPRFFAFPRDYVGHISLLKEFGFVTFRDVPPKLYPCLKLDKTIPNYVNTYFSLFIQFLSYYFLVPPHVTNITENIQGLWSVPGCLAYGKKRWIPLRLVTHKAIQGINRAARERKIFSMYTHLKNFGNPHFFSNFKDVISHVCEKRESGELEVTTLGRLVSGL